MPSPKSTFTTGCVLCQSQRSSSHSPSNNSWPPEKASAKVSTSRLLPKRRGRDRKYAFPLVSLIDESVGFCRRSNNFLPGCHERFECRWEAFSCGGLRLRRWESKRTAAPGRSGLALVQARTLPRKIQVQETGNQQPATEQGQVSNLPLLIHRPPRIKPIRAIRGPSEPSTQSAAKPIAQKNRAIWDRSAFLKWWGCRAPARIHLSQPCMTRQDDGLASTHH